MALTAGTATALADSNDAIFLAKLRNLGVTWVPGTADNDLIAMGRAVCVDRKSGETPDQIAADIHASFSQKGFSFAESAAIVNAAESTYCP
jgi:hypothetical protein